MKKVLICGLGAVGMTYAVKFNKKCELKILVDEKRLKKYTLQKPVFNGEEQDFEYILPNRKFEPDLIIIAVKSQNLDEAIQNIKNFIYPNVRIISLLNGISSEENIKQNYPQAKVLKSYFIGHSAVREGNSVTQDGVGEIVLEYDKEVCEILNSSDVNYSAPDNIDYAMWLKYTMNLFSNQTSAILNMNFGELKRNKHFIDFAKKIILEVKNIAEKKGIQNLENLEKDALAFLNRMCDEGKTSMHQDVLAGRNTEVEIFAGEIIRLGKALNVPTPYNQVMYDLIKIEEENNEYRVHSC